MFNDGHADGSNILVTDLIPAACTFVSVSCADATSIGLDVVANTLRCEITRLAAGQSATILMTVNLSQWGDNTINHAITPHRYCLALFCLSTGLCLLAIALITPALAVCTFPDAYQTAEPDVVEGDGAVDKVALKSRYIV